MRLDRRTPQIGAQPRAEPHIEDECQRDRADGQLDRGIGEEAREQPAAGDTEYGAGQQTFRFQALHAR